MIRIHSGHIKLKWHFFDVFGLNVHINLYFCVYLNKKVILPSLILYDLFTTSFHCCSALKIFKIFITRQITLNNKSVTEVIKKITYK